ncbi:hypothetical protein CsSME_00023928 [Camellia sinensis var. sinensis]
MVKGKKQWLKLGDLRTKKLTEYEKQRNKRIKENCEVMNKLEVKNITNSLVSVVYPKCANAKEKGIRVEVDDDDEYKPSESEDDNDDESLGSFDRKDQETPPGLRLQSHSRLLNPTPEEGTDPLCQDISTQPLLPHNVQPEHKTRGRGPTRSIQAQRIVDKDGKMLDIGTQPLLPHNMQPEHEVTTSSSIASQTRGRGPTRGIQPQRIVNKDGKMLQASKLASKIGIEVRTQLPGLSVRRWKKVNNAKKEPIIQRLAFDDDEDGICVIVNLNINIGTATCQYHVHSRQHWSQDMKHQLSSTGTMI